MIKKIAHLLIEPRLAFIVFTIFVITYLIILDEEGAFKDKFLNFGPSEDTKFLNMKLNTWKKVIIVYIIGFLTALLKKYYTTISYDFIHSYLWNPSYTKKIKISKAWASVIVSVEPLLFWILDVLSFFVNFTMELQYIIPQFLGTLFVEVPYALYKVSQNKFIS